MTTELHRANERIKAEVKKLKSRVDFLDGNGDRYSESLLAYRFKYARTLEKKYGVSANSDLDNSIELSIEAGNSDLDSDCVIDYTLVIAVNMCARAVAWIRNWYLASQKYRIFTNIGPFMIN